MYMCVQSYVLYVCVNALTPLWCIFNFPFWGVSGSVCVCVGACGMSVCKVGLQVYNPVCLVEWAIYA